MYLKKTRSYQDLVTRLDEQLLLEYNDEFIKKYVGIFIKQNPNTTSEAITELIKRFDQLKSGTTKNEIKTIIKNSIQNGDIKAKEGDVDDETWGKFKAQMKSRKKKITQDWVDDVK